MKSPLIILLLFFIFQISNTYPATCPQNKEIDILYQKAISLGKAGKTQESITILQRVIHLSKSIGCLQHELNGNDKLMRQYAKLHEYQKALHISTEVERLAFLLKDYRQLSILYTTRATLYNYLSLNDQSFKEYKQAEKYAQLISNTDQRHYELSMIYYNLATYYQGQLDYPNTIASLVKSEREIQKVQDNSTDIGLEKKMDMLLSINMNLGILSFGKENPQKDIKLAESYFLKALDIQKNMSENMSTFTKIDLFSALLEFYYKKKDYRKGIEYGEKALTLEKSHKMPYNRRVVYMVLAKCYLGINETAASEKYLNLYSKLNDSINAVEKIAVEEPIKQIVSESTKTNNQKLKYTLITYSILLALLIITGITVWNKKRKTLYRKYEDLIASLQSPPHKVLSGNSALKTVQFENNTHKSKSINITDETIENLLSGLEKFERLKLFTRQDVNSAYLTNYLNTNSKYLTEILRQYKGKTFSQYINDLRIDYIIRLLYEDPKYREYKISYLAGVCGFSSREIFTITFKKNTGISPSYFINELNLNSKTGKTS